MLCSAAEKSNADETRELAFVTCQHDLSIFAFVNIHLIILSCLVRSLCRRAKAALLRRRQLSNSWKSLQFDVLPVMLGSGICIHT